MHVSDAIRWDGVLVRYGELGIKSAPVRRQMVAKLRDNLFAGMLREGIEGDVSVANARLWLVGPDPEALHELATRTFGVVSASLVRRTQADLTELGAVAGQLALTHEWESFAIRASREGQHGFTSQDIGIQVGSHVFTAAEAHGRFPKVDLTSPDLEVHIEVRGKRGFVFLDKTAGPGGLPRGSQGTVAALVSDPASFAAAWLMMRRGCDVVPIHAGTMGSQPLDCLEAMRAWGLPSDLELLPVCSGSVAKKVLLEAAARIAADHGAVALVTGDTLDSRLLAPADVPVLRPVCGLEPSRLARLVERIGLEDESEDLLDEAASETVESLLAMRRTVS